MTRRPCSDCGRNRAPRFFVSERGRVCLDCQRKRRSETAHRNRILRTYGLTEGQYGALLIVQGGRCAICAGERPYRLNVDHDHATGLVRGLLCRRCNKLLRDVRDDLDVLAAARRYLAETPAERVGIFAAMEEA